MRSSFDDTIVAPATATGDAAIAIVRLSGPKCREIVAKLTQHVRPRLSHRLMRARLLDSQSQLLDDAMVVEMHAPHSYTGEDVAELQVHGSRHVVRAVLQACQDFGARLAEPGEFTFRAYAHGRMDLAQAEAVGQLIAAKSHHQRQLAALQLQGGLSKAINETLNILETMLSHWRAALDFPEYPTGDGLEKADFATLQTLHQRLLAWMGSAQITKNRGTKVVLCGAPNVGKSSLMNALLGYERVLVDSTPGTTRDPIEVELDDGSLCLSLWDTAGIRDTTANLEVLSISQSYVVAADADVILWLLTGENPVWPPEDFLTATQSITTHKFLLGSKQDLASKAQQENLVSQAAKIPWPFFGWVSTHDTQTLVALKQRLVEQLLPHSSDDVMIGAQRHVLALQEAASTLEQLLLLMQEDQTLDVLAMLLENTLRSLGSIVGRNVDAAVLDKIFSEFCIGK